MKPLHALIASAVVLSLAGCQFAPVEGRVEYRPATVTQELDETRVGPTTTVTRFKVKPPEPTVVSTVLVVKPCPPRIEHSTVSNINVVSESGASQPATPEVAPSESIE
jgi:hypothetical protein